MATREQDYITQARAYTRAIWDNYHRLIDLQSEWNALDYGNTLDDGTGDNAGITKAMVGAVVFDTMNEFKLRLIDTGHKTNLAKLL